MVQFGKKLAAVAHEPWKEHYFDYNHLKRILEVEPDDDDEEGTTTEHHEDDSDPEKDFCQSLDREIEKCVLFFLQQQGQLALRCAALKEEERRLGVRVLEWHDLQRFADASDVDEGSAEVGEEISEGERMRLELQASVMRLGQSYRAIGQDLLHLVRYAELTITGVRKILKKHDKQLSNYYYFSSNRSVMSNSNISQYRLTDRYLSEHWLDQASGSNPQQTDDSHLKQLRHLEGVGALVTTLKQSFQELQQLERRLSMAVPPSSPMLMIQKQQHYQSEPRPKPRRSLTVPVLTIPSLLTPEEEHAATHSSASNNGHDHAPALPPLAPTKPTPVHSRQKTAGVQPSPHEQQQQHTATSAPPASSVFFLGEPVLLRIDAARRRLQESSRLVQLLAAPILLEHDDEDAHSEQDGSSDDSAIDFFNDYEAWMQRRTAAQAQAAASAVSNFLNLASTFLFLTNYYIAAPTAGAYAAKLGESEALAGVVIGMTPMAAIVSTLLYSWWTSYSYKSALVFASLCALAGNLLYALAQPYRSLPFMLVGRLLVGFASCRSINRRYIADSYRIMERTAASAAFVTAGSLGMAAGPALAALLAWLEPFVRKKKRVPLYWSVENTPGWLMFGMWVVYLVLVLVYFRDPPKRRKVTVVVSSDNDRAEEGGAGETTALLASAASDAAGRPSAEASDHAEEEEVVEHHLWQNIPVMGTLFFCFVLKMALECCLSPAATITAFYFRWAVQESGIYLALLGLLMFPTNLVVAYFCRRHYGDRDLILVTLLLMVVGAWGVINYGNGPYSAVQYITFSVVMFVGTNALEGPNMSLLSKTIPTSWARGFFNMGLLATEAGNLGRSVGDLLFAWCGTGGLDTLLNHLFVSLGLIVTLAFATAYTSFPYLEPHDRDD